MRRRSPQRQSKKNTRATKLSWQSLRESCVSTPTLAHNLTMILQFRVCGHKERGKEGGGKRRGCNPAVSSPGWSHRDKGGRERTKPGRLPACRPSQPPIIKPYHLTMTMQSYPYIAAKYSQWVTETLVSPPFPYMGNLTVAINLTVAPSRMFSCTLHSNRHNRATLCGWVCITFAARFEF